MRVLRTLAAAVLIAGPATAGQPISVSLSECAAIFEEMSRFTSRQSTPERTAWAAEVANGFARAAIAEAQREGVQQPAGHVADWLDRNREKWAARMRDPVFMPENREWIDYCRAVGKSRGVPELNRPVPGSSG